MGSDEDEIMTRPATDYEAQKIFVKRLDPSGQRMCQMPSCSNTLKGRQQRWCSEKCGLTAFSMWNWAGTRHRVFERDKGICSKCGRDCVALKECFVWYMQFMLRQKHMGYLECEKVVAAFMKAAGVVGKHAYGKDLWEADHIIPLAEGGALCDLANLRTMCVFGCHKEETRKLVKRLAKAKRIQRKHSIGYVPLRFQ
jgi:5-methylcytosine-specific restriction endonuclease McrA